MAKKTNVLLWFIAGGAVVYFFHGQISSLVNKVTGSFSGSAFYGPTYAFHTKTPRAGTRVINNPHVLGFQRPGFPGQGQALGRYRNPYVY